ncbi:MAG: PIN domain-containing protein, partial [Oscillospiraceae bacterium]|nr:PIN domain-containing protein [Oscillospiraceae bacterium]
MLPQKNIKILDANIILRFLMKDNAEMAAEAIEIIKENNVLVTMEVAAEVVFVMQKVYKATRKDIHHMIMCFVNISNVEVSDYLVLSKGLEIFRDNNLDFVDCILCAYNLCRGYEVCT